MGSEDDRNALMLGAQGLSIILLCRMLTPRPDHLTVHVGFPVILTS